MKNLYYLNSTAIILRATGRDSRRYLNARLSNDIKILAAGACCYAAALSPQGRAEGYFAVICKSDEEFYLICDGGSHDEIIKAFKRYIVADRISVEDISSENRHFILFNPAAEISGALATFPSKRAAEKTSDFIVPLSSSARFEEDLKTSGYIALSKEKFHLLGVKDGIPSFPAEINEGVIFSASGLDYAVSFKKGCYVGQEVIEKIDAYGRVPYVLKAAVLDGKIDGKPSVKVNNSNLADDKILSVSYDQTEDKTYFFLELKNTDKILDYEISINDNKARLI